MSGRRRSGNMKPVPTTLPRIKHGYENETKSLDKPENIFAVKKALTVVPRTTHACSPVQFLLSPLCRRSWPAGPANYAFACPETMIHHRGCRFLSSGVIFIQLEKRSRRRSQRTADVFHARYRKHQGADPLRLVFCRQGGKCHRRRMKRRSGCAYIVNQPNVLS